MGRVLALVMLKDRQPEHLDKSEKAILDAIEGVELLDPAQNSICAFQCRANATAVHIAGDGVCVCPRMKSYPLPSLLFVLAHEITHAGDICAMERTQLKMKEHPFEQGAVGGSLIGCLVANGIRIGSRKKVKKEKAQKHLEAVGIFDPDEFEFLYNKVQGHPDCLQTSRSNVQEASADLLAFEALGEYFKDNPLKETGPQAFYKAFGFLLETGCAARDKASQERQRRRGHPSHLERITKIALSIPSLRTALGCSGHTENLNCEYRPPLMNKQPAKARQ